MIASSVISMNSGRMRKGGNSGIHTGLFPPMSLVLRARSPVSSFEEEYSGLGFCRFYLKKSQSVQNHRKRGM